MSHSFGKKAASYTGTRSTLDNGLLEVFRQAVVYAEFLHADEILYVLWLRDVQQSDGVVSAIAREHILRADIRTRYRLSAVGESWKIISID